MKRLVVLPIVLATFATVACRRDISVDWFAGDLEDAKKLAERRDTVVMVEFYAEWCNWCRRLESDTFSVPTVLNQLNRIVTLRLDAEKEGADLARRFGVDSYPTMVFLDPAGNELDRVIGYLPPDRFFRRVERIRAGDTFLACLRELEKEPGSVKAIERSVFGLLERSDAEGAINRIEAFRRATDGKELALSRKLMFTARSELHSRVYQRAGKLFRSGWDRAFEVPDTTGTSRLHALIAGDLERFAVDDQSELLRQARHDDAADILDIPDLVNGTPEMFFAVADFAFRNGHYDLAADLYARWYETGGDGADPNDLNDVAWRLYLSGRALETAIDIAQQSYAAKAEPATADTLARLLYITGSVREAISIEERAAREAEGSRGENYVRLAQLMEAGEPLDDAPSFESYPGRRHRAL